MSPKPPTLVAIDHDDYHAEHVGRTADGRQFFLTTPFEAASKRHPGGEYVALYIFDPAGKLIEATIDDFGPRASLNKDARRNLYESRLRELGPVELCRIEVSPFAVQRFGTKFGLVLREPDDAEDVYAVEVQPGNYMAFFEPWDSGIYDT